MSSAVEAFPPEEWAADSHHRTRTLLPREVTHREKGRLALDMLNTSADRGMTPPAVVADPAYGTKAHLRAGLPERGPTHVLSIRSHVLAHPVDVQPMSLDRQGDVGCWPQPRYRQRAPSVAVLATAIGQEAVVPLRWRQGSKGEPGSRFAAVRGRPAGKAVERRAAQPPRPGRAGGTAPCPTVGYWPNGLSAPPRRANTGCPTCRLTRRSSISSAWPRSAGASPTTTESSSAAHASTTSTRLWPGWHHHFTLVTAAQASSLNGACPPKKHRDQHHPLPDPRRSPGHPEVLDRDLHQLPATAPDQNPYANKIKKDLTECHLPPESAKPPKPAGFGRPSPSHAIASDRGAAATDPAERQRPRVPVPVPVRSHSPGDPKAPHSTLIHVQVAQKDHPKRASTPQSRIRDGFRHL
ncbi:transposase [Streptomyces sp. NPDC005195]|uniref:transposase n=1 Tax=Streptomyces sp. NPDC005195 TaxID=3154561 RepID=UPI0033AB5465